MLSVTAMLIDFYFVGRLSVARSWRMLKSPVDVRDDVRSQESDEEGEANMVFNGVQWCSFKRKFEMIISTS